MLTRFAAALISTFILAVPAWSEPPSCNTVRMAEPGWTDLAFTTGIASTLLTGLGYEPRSTVLGINVIYTSLTNNDLDVFLGYWDPAMKVYFDPYRDKGTIETVHKNLEGAKFTFAVPAYVHAAGVKDFSDLSKFADKFGHKMYGMEAGSNEIMLKVVKEPKFKLGDWEVVESSEQGMLSQVARAVGSKEWIVFAGWAPHPMNNVFELEYLTGGDDYYGPGFGGATVHTQVRKGYMQECPNVAKLLQQLTFDIPLENKGMGYILDDGMSAEDAAKKLLREHPEKLEPWLAGVMTQDGQEGLPAVRKSLGL